MSHSCFLFRLHLGDLQMVVALWINRSGTIRCLLPISLPPPQKREGVRVKSEWGGESEGLNKGCSERSING